MPLSYSSPSSSSEASLHPFNPCYYDGDYGVMKNCFCGKHIELEVRTVDNITKTYQKCPMSGKDDTKYHINNWWDQVVSEQFHCIDRRLDEQKEMIQGAVRFGGDTNRQAIEEMRLEIEELKERLDKKDGEIARLMELIVKK